MKGTTENIQRTEHTKNAKNTRRKPEIIIVPHYVGTEKAEAVFKRVITDEIRRKIEKSA